MPTPYDIVVENLKLLTPVERGRIAARIKAGASLSSPSDAGPRGSSDEDEVLEAISAVVARLSGEVASPIGLRRTMQFKAFRDKVPDLAMFVARHAPDRTRRRALYDLGFELLYGHNVSMGLPTSARALMQHAHRLPSVLDAAFPGYARGGILGLVVGRSEEVEGGNHGSV